MKSILCAAIIFNFFSLAQNFASGVDPRTNSWFTAYSGQYARIFTNNTMKAAGNTLTTWSNGSQTQSAPAYCGVQEVDSSADWVYVFSTGLAGYNMGPWQNGAFPNLPVNQKLLYRFPRTNGVPANKTLTGGGQIGIFVDGVEMFNSWDAFSWNGSADVASMGGNTGYWNRDAYVNEGATFDPGNAHQQNTGTYHYHANPIALRFQLGDHVAYDLTAKTYSESTNVVTRHSPILGWVGDGSPIYGPYGYSNPTNAASSVRRMISGYVIRDGSFGTSNLTANGRSTIPQWAVRAFGVSSNQSGPGVNGTYPLGRYMEDNDYLGDHGYAQGVVFDLDEYNGRWCVTPEFPAGTYAYFVSISSNGAPTFPYNIGRAYYGSATGGNVAGIGETVVTNFVGGSGGAFSLSTPSKQGATVTLTWSSVEGGSYRVESTTDLNNWTTNATNIVSQGINTRTNLNSAASATFYRVARTELAAYDPVSDTSGGGGGQIITLTPNSGSRSQYNISITAVISASATPPAPPHSGAPVQTFMIGTMTVSGASYVYNGGTGTVTGTLSIPSDASLAGQTVTITFGPPPGQQTGPTYTQSNAFTVNP
jgi:YHYH protein